MKKLVFGIFCCLSIAGASHSTPKDKISLESNSSFSLGASLSSFSSNTTGTIYTPQGEYKAGRKTSELIWKATDTPMLGIDAGYLFKKKIGIYVSYKTNISNGDALLDMKDWTDQAKPSEHTSSSSHPNTNLEKITILDLGVKYNVNFQNLNSLFSLGYKQDSSRYKAYDGIGKIGDDTVEKVFNGLGVTYNQEYKGPYLGLELNLEDDDYKLFLKTKYSPFVDVSYTSNHHADNLAYASYFDKTYMLSYNVGIDGKITKNSILRFSYEYVYYDYVYGNVQKIDSISTELLINGSAVESDYSVLSLSYAYSF